MPWNSDPDFLTVLSVLFVSLISGFISIAQRIARGAVFSVLWLLSELCAALLCGYLMSDIYPNIKHLLPTFCTYLVMVVIAAHTGSRLLQTMENAFVKRVSKMMENG